MIKASLRILVLCLGALCVIVAWEALRDAQKPTVTDAALREWAPSTSLKELQDSDILRINGTTFRHKDGIWQLPDGTLMDAKKIQKFISQIQNLLPGEPIDVPKNLWPSLGLGFNRHLVEFWRNDINLLSVFVSHGADPAMKQRFIAHEGKVFALGEDLMLPSSWKDFWLGHPDTWPTWATLSQIELQHWGKPSIMLDIDEGMKMNHEFLSGDVAKTFQKSFQLSDFIGLQSMQNSQIQGRIDMVERSGQRWVLEVMVSDGEHFARLIAPKNHPDYDLLRNVWLEFQPWRFDIWTMSLKGP